MNRTTRVLLIGFLLLLLASRGFSQAEDCNLTLSHSEAEFTAGHFYGIPALLNECLTTNGFTKEQKVRAYILLCQVYLIINDPTAADDNYLKLLRVDPEYVANEVRDPIDVVYLSKKFTSTPIFTPHVRAGINTSLFRGIYPNSTQPYETKSSATLSLNVQIGAGMDWNITDNISLCIEADLASRGYHREITGIAYDDRLSITASQSWVDVPLYLKYSDNRDKKIRPFGYVGVAMNLLISASNTFVLEDKKPSSSVLITEGPAESVYYQQNILNRSWLIGGGIKYKVGKNFLFADLRYMGGLSNMTEANKAYYANASNSKSNLGNSDYVLSNNVTRYLYAGDLFRLDNVSLSFGYIVPLYNPRKVKIAKTKSVSRRIRKGNDKEEGSKK